MPVMLPGSSWLIYRFTHPASVSASWAWVITLLRVTRNPNHATHANTASGVAGRGRRCGPPAVRPGNAAAHKERPATIPGGLLTTGPMHIRPNAAPRGAYVIERAREGLEPASL